MTKLKSPSPKKNQDNISPYQWPVTSILKLSRCNYDKPQLFTDTLFKRESRRAFNKINRHEVGELLYLSNRTLIRKRNKQNILVEHRPVISSGGIHAVDCLILLPDETVWNRYDPLNHQFESLTVNTKEITELTILARQFFPTSKNAAIIWYIGDLTRITGKYNNAESLLWRDAGAILATQSLTAEYLNYAFCPLGITGEYAASCLSGERELLGLGLSLVGINL